MVSHPTAGARFKLSNDPKFVDKLRAVVGLYLDAPAHAIVLSVDEKSQIRRSTAPTRPADEEGAARYDEARLQAQRHHHPVRRPQRPILSR